MTTQRTTKTTRTTVKPNSRKSNVPSTSTAVTPSSSEVLLPPAFLELAPDGIIVADAVGYILLVNQQIEVLFGYNRSELIGHPVEILLPARVQAAHEQHRARYAAAPHTRPMGTGLELLGRRHDGGEFPVEVSLSPLPSGHDLLVIAIIRDVSERTPSGTRTPRASGATPAAS